MTSSSQIRKTTRRNTIQVTINDNTILEGAVGTTLEAFLQHALSENLLKDSTALIGAVFDGKLRELAYPVKRDGIVQPVHLSSSDGGRIYRRSLVLLLTTAAAELWPGAKVNVNYAIPDGGFFCAMDNLPQLGSEQVAQLEACMKGIVEADAPITKRIVPLQEAIKIFEERGDDDKVRLLDYRTRNELTLYTLRGRDDYYFGYMVPSTGYLKTFRLIPVNDGFILQYPRKETSEQLDNITAYSKLSQVFRQSDEWLARMEVEDIGRLNHLVRNRQIHELILVAEALHEQNIAAIATEIVRHHRELGTRLVLIAGPSSSGKTTFAKRLSIQLLAQGLRPFTLEMDNYFVDRELTPKDAQGQYDFEAIGAINLPLFNDHLIQLMDGQQVALPRFDFREGRSVAGRTVQLKSNQIVIIEGIHGLNPALVPNIPQELIFRIYVSALTALNIDAHNRVPTTDVRLLRRLVRDARSRGYNAVDTLSRWPSVRSGEKLNIFPYQENADMMFNSSLAYELAALRGLAEPLLLQVLPNTPAHIEANRLLSFLNWVQPLLPREQGMIPDTSLLREFIGNSILENYHPGEFTHHE